MTSTLKEDIADFADCWLRGHRILAGAYAKLCTLKLNKLAGKDGWTA